MKKAWTKIGDYSANVLNVSIPSEAKELLIKVTAANGSAISGNTFYLIREQFTDSDVQYTSGWYYRSNDYGSITVTVNKNKIVSAYITKVGTSLTPVNTTAHYR